jgi:hypothetical protein
LSPVGTVCDDTAIGVVGGECTSIGLCAASAVSAGTSSSRLNGVWAFLGVVGVVLLVLALEKGAGPGLRRRWGLAAARSSTASSRESAAQAARASKVHRALKAAFMAGFLAQPQNRPVEGDDESVRAKKLELLEAQAELLAAQFLVDFEPSVDADVQLAQIFTMSEATGEYEFDFTADQIEEAKSAHLAAGDIRDVGTAIKAAIHAGVVGDMPVTGHGVHMWRMLLGAEIVQPSVCSSKDPQAHFELTADNVINEIHYGDEGKEVDRLEVVPADGEGGVTQERGYVYAIIPAAVGFEIMMEHFEGDEDKRLADYEAALELDLASGPAVIGMVTQPGPYGLIAYGSCAAAARAIKLFESGDTPWSLEGGEVTNVRLLSTEQTHSAAKAAQTTAVDLDAPILYNLVRVPQGMCVAPHTL